MEVMFGSPYRYLTITIVSKNLNKFSSTLLLLKRKRLLVNYPFPLTDLHQNRKAWVLYNSGTYAKNDLILFEFAAVIVCHRKISTDTHTHTHTDTFQKTTFFHVLSVVQWESAIILNTIFFCHHHTSISLRNMEVIKWNVR